MKYAMIFLRILLAAAFGMAGFAKLSGNPMMVGVFAAVGLGQWFRLFTGGLEVAGALGLLASSHTAGWAAAGLSVVMVGAVLSHLFILGGSPAAPLVLLALSALVAWYHLKR